jgi:hypothetical protein
MIDQQRNVGMTYHGPTKQTYHATPVPRLVLLVSVLLLSRALAAAESSDTYAQRTLRGLQGVGIVIEHLNADAERDGLTKEQIRTAVEGRLRQAGIPVLAREAWTKTPGLPYLYVRVEASKTPYNFYAIAIQIELWQAVVLLRDPTITTLALTWKTPGMIGGVVSARIHEVQKIVGEDVEAFIHDYLAMNPHPDTADGSMPRGKQQ